MPGRRSKRAQHALKKLVKKNIILLISHPEPCVPILIVMFRRLLKVSFRMKVHIALLFLLSLTISCTEGRKEKGSACHTVWEGTFFNEHNGEVDTKIVRKGDIQIELYKNTGVCKLKVEWLDSCSYRLTYIPGGKGCPIKDAGKTVIVQILEVRESSYLIEGWVEGQTAFKYKSELHKSK